MSFDSFIRPKHKPIKLLAVAVVLAASIAGGLVVRTLHTFSSSRIAMPDSLLTPGDILPVTADDICVEGYASKVRHVTESEKKQVYLLYGIKTHKPGQYEVDHLISLELGGSNNIKNLWPQPYSGHWNAHDKDKLENKLHELVCNGSLTLQQAQEEIRTDWVEAYQKYISP